MRQIVISEFMDESAVDRLSSAYEVLYDAGLVDRPDALAAALADAAALIVRNRTQVRPPLLDAAPGLKVVGRLGVGLDNIDMEACRERGIAVRPATGANNTAVAEYVIAAVLMLLRGAFLSRDEMLAGSWPRGALMGNEISGKTLGLVGFGAIARETAARAQALGMSVIGYDPFIAPDDPAWGYIQPCALDELVAEADAVSLHVPLTEETRHIIDAGRLAAMRPGAVVVNAARGGVVDEAALADALRHGTLGGAALDVFETEPLTAEAAGLFDGIDNLILTPHIAGVTQESNVRVSAVTADNVRQVLETQA